MVRFIVQRMCTKNDSNGNPRRVFVVWDDEGRFRASFDESYGSGALALAEYLFLRGVNGFDHRSQLDWQRAPGVTRIDDVDVAPGVYRRFLRRFE